MTAARAQAAIYAFRFPLALDDLFPTGNFLPAILTSGNNKWSSTGHTFILRIA